MEELKCKPMTEKQVICSKINWVQNMVKDLGESADHKNIVALLQTIKVEIRNTL
jgi:hypothetical protein